MPLQYVWQGKAMDGTIIYSNAKIIIYNTMVVIDLSEKLPWANYRNAKYMDLVSFALRTDVMPDSTIRIAYSANEFIQFQSETNEAMQHLIHFVVGRRMLNNPDKPWNILKGDLPIDFEDQLITSGDIFIFPAENGKSPIFMWNGVLQNIMTKQIYWNGEYNSDDVIIVENGCYSTASGEYLPCIKLGRPIVMSGALCKEYDGNPVDYAILSPRDNRSMTKTYIPIKYTGDKILP